MVCLIASKHEPTTLSEGCEVCNLDFAARVRLSVFGDCNEITQMS